MRPSSTLLSFAFVWTMLAAIPVAHATSTCPANNLLATPTADFTINGNGTVTHDQTGLMWKQCSEGLSGASCNAGGAMVTATLMNWNDALVSAATPFAGYSDWRLPNQKELLSIVETGCFNPSINETIFPNTPFNNLFWSSTTLRNPTQAGYAMFNYGYSGTMGKNALFYVRLVRNGQPLDSFDAKKKAQVIVFGTAPTLVVGGTGTVSATGGASLNPVIFSSLSSGVCTISGSTVTGVSAGSCTIAANQAGNFQYNAAAQVTQSFNVDKANQTIHFGTAPTVVVGGTGVVFAVTSAGFAVSYGSATPGVCTISGNTVTGVTVGACTITGDHHGNTNYYAAPQAMQSFSIGKGNQAIMFYSTPTLAVGGTDTLGAIGGASGNPVTFSSNTLSVCTTTVPSTVTGVAAGSCTVAANQVGNANYNAAPQVTLGFSVGKGNQTIVFGPAPTLGLNGLAVVSATGGASGNPVTFSSTTLNVCTITGSTVTGVTLGACTIAADQLGNTNYYAAPQVLQSLVVIDTTVRLNDTGLDRCWDGSALVVCSPTNSGNAAAHPRQDARFGRDAAAAAGQLTKLGGGDKGFDFTRVCMSGEMAGQGACPANPVQGTGANQWACTRDNVTHRIWSLDSTVYNWISASTTYPAAMNASNRCGYNTGWRLPTRRELFSIVHSGRSNPTIDTAYFPGTPVVSYPSIPVSYYWSVDSSFAALTEAWIVDFEAGYTFDWAKTNYIYARLVHSGP